MSGRSVTAVALRAWVALVFVALFAPLVAMSAMSFNASRYSTLPFRFSTTWYAALRKDGELVQSTWLSVELAVLVAGVVGFAVLAGFAVWWWRTR